jgi:diguanylate cyclase (GGDEF)-like protein/PAS domain S-box-containing protein
LVRQHPGGTILDAAKILIVDDDPQTSQELALALTERGFQISSIERTGSSGIDRAGQTYPDLVLMDILPEGSMDGVAAADQIIRRFGIPVILLTEWIDAAVIHRVRFTQISALLLKPVNEQQLYGTIQLTLLKRSTSELSVTDQEAVHILQQSNQGVMISDADSRITFMNPVAEKLTGWSKEEAIGKQFHDVFQTVAGESSAMISDVPAPAETSCLKNKEGKLIVVESTVMFLHHKSGHLSGTAIQFRDISEHKATEDALRRSRENLNSLIQCVNGIVWESDLQREKFSYVSNQATAILGYSVQEWRSNTGFWARHLAAEDSQVVRDVERIFVLQRRNYVLKYRMVTSAGKTVWLKDHVQVIYHNNTPIRLRGVMEDITSEKAAEIRLYESQERYRMLVDSAPDVIFSLSATNGVITMLNPAFEKITGLRAAQWIGKSFISLLHPDDVNMAIALYERTISGESIPPIEIRFRSQTEEYLFGEVTTLPAVKNNQCIGITGIVRNITDRKLAEEKLIRSAFYDALTGLPNRALLMDRLGHAILRSKRRKEDVFAVLFIDLDRFKLVNDSLGHRLGDELLVNAARRLEDCLRMGDTIARIGGDEFILLLDNIQDIQEAQEIAGRIQHVFSLPFQIGNQELFATTSIGIALSSSKYERPEEILRDADLAMYRAKSLGRARTEVFDTALHSQALTILQMETDLRRSIERSELCIFYQPIVHLSSGKISGMEALVRWKHPHRGLIEASDFIQLAEDSGLIHSIGENVLWQSCSQLREWQMAFGDSFQIGLSVNLSGKQFSNPRLLKEILAILDSTGMEPAFLTLEITETVLMENRRMAEDLMEGLHKLRVKLHIDDFGTGYSSLGYLRRFPIDALKIDRSFVQSIHENSEIVRTILTLAKNMDLQAIAEGIENNQQLQHLIALGCQYGQGFYFSEPLPASVIPAFLESFPDISAATRTRDTA